MVGKRVVGKRGASHDEDDDHDGEIMMMTIATLSMTTQDTVTGVQSSSNQ